MRILSKPLVFIAVIGAEVGLAVISPALAQVSAFMSGDHLSVGRGSYSGFGVGLGWRGLEFGYRHINGQQATSDGASADLYWHWHNYFATAGVSYLDVMANGGAGWQVAPRVGAGIQFGPVRAAIRYEQFNHVDGLSLSVGLSIPIAGSRP